MKKYSNKITLVKNKRGVYCLDTTMGCSIGLGGGCYGECYAVRWSKRSGVDFSQVVLRSFESDRHRTSIVNKIKNIDMPFIRIGCNGDPSDNWEHTLSICSDISKTGKTIVIITKHLNNLTELQLKEISNMDIIFNTSVSALDDKKVLTNRLEQYDKLKYYCKSVLRIVSCDFNTSNNTGKRLAHLQEELFNNEFVIDTVFRVSKNNRYVVDGIINITKARFLKRDCYVSKYNKKTFFGYCSTCPEMCGINI